MTEHEHHQPQPKEPERRPLPPDDLDPKLLDTALAAMRRYAESGRGYGDAFRAYLDLGLDIDLHEDVDEESDFRERYIGHWPDRTSFVHNRIRELGWDAALTALQTDFGIWPGDLTWDEGVVWEHLEGFYELSERFEGVYAFRR